jgi:hypothetical protein
MEKLCNIIEGKADAAAVEHLTMLLESKLDKSEAFSIRQELSNKSEKSDIDLYVRAVQSQRTDFEARQS